MRSLRTAGLSVSAVVIVTIAWAPAVAQAGPAAPHYRLVDLGTFGGPNSAEEPEFPYVSNRGTVVGFADTATPDDTDHGFTYHAFRWRDGVLTDLGTLPGGRNSVALAVNDREVVAGFSDDGAGGSVAVTWGRTGRIAPLGSLGGAFGLAADINERGQIVGATTNATPEPDGWFGWPTQSRPFLWENGVLRELPTLGGRNAGAFFINEPGQVAGNSATANGDIHPFRWQRGRMIDLGSLGGHNGFVNALNDRGQVVGLSDLPGDQETHPFLWSRGRLEDLGTFGGGFGVATAVNNAGEVTGRAGRADGTEHAFYWRNGVKTDIGTVTGDTCSEAHDMNASGQIVGTSGHCDGNPSEHGFLWLRGTGLIDLNAYVPAGSDLTMMDGETINDHGVIAGTGRLPNGDFHAVVLLPCHGHRPGCR